jgi:hypothetical protein
MTFRRNSLITQPSLPGLPAHPDPYLAWRASRILPRGRKRRPSAAERRLEAARRDPRQTSIFGPQHTDELAGF